MHEENAWFQIICSASAYPKPDINLEFRKCVSKELCEDFVVQDMPVRTVDNGTQLFWVIWKLTDSSK